MCADLLSEARLDDHLYRLAGSEKEDKKCWNSVNIFSRGGYCQRSHDSIRITIHMPRLRFYHDASRYLNYCDALRCIANFH